MSLLEAICTDPPQGMPGRKLNWVVAPDQSWSPADGVTHWSLTGSRDTDKDAFLSFSDGVSRSGTGLLLWVLGAGSWVPALRRPQAASSVAVVSAEVEMTAYALLTYTLLGDVATALPVVKWLSQQRNALGGFSSTQVS